MLTERYEILISLSIGKTSSAELSEAINTMFIWYRNPSQCFVYMSDVHTPQPRSSEEKEAFLRPDGGLGAGHSKSVFGLCWTSGERL
jgi:hypothetical protein